MKYGLEIQQDLLKRYMKIKVNGEKIYQLTDMCQWKVIDNKLYNLNIKRFEAVDGDIIIIKELDGTLFADIVEGYTCFQVVKTKHKNERILSASVAYNNVEIMHYSKVELIDEE